MEKLRCAKVLARFMLMWFALSIGAAIASPIIKPQAMELICSGSGAIKVLIKTDDGVKEARSHTLDCPLCACAATPPSTRARAEPSQPLAYLLRPVPAAHIAWLTAAPLPARGPPAFS